ncbi:uncharacterized protein PODANS_7_10350 [Podospora anserina S mat+]|uniref:Podospora anserina S mat+ genomic DNA chromosome 7, supercontig 1 n=1 Tax=Podospora anserina (strain S / ATCC MYA-4624 / DSM 980 / FGSC 10383) TaxID=515849 RepID=B2AXF1_PODAN|nr:uncharacterized protein PODANS_7_10350 [Podospora anserina S mat+]CAP69075.1 unnamed protein product [Podospora anserina S mat+]
MIKDQPSHPAPEGEGVGEATSTELVKQEGTEVAEGEETEEVNGEEGDGNGNDQEQNADGTAKPVTGGFGMGFGGNFEQMPMMMAMNNGFGSFPMMGQSNFTCVGGFQGMGMNGMNMNMGMGAAAAAAGYGGEADNWSGQQSWNVGQDNYNHPSASGMGNGDYGSFNSGFQTGYNQGNYGHPNQFNDYRRNQWGGFPRGRGRGRGYGYGGGGYGRGNFHNGGYGGGNYNDQNFNNGQQQYPGSMNGQGSEFGGGENGEGAVGPNDGTVDEFGRSIRADDGAEGAADGHQDGVPHHQGEGGEEGAHHQGEEGGPAQPADEVLINAPKGPKAMLRGLPNTSYIHLQARGWVDDGKPNTPNSANGTAAPSQAGDHPRSRSSSPSGSRRGGGGEDYHHHHSHRDRDHEAYHSSWRERGKSSRHEGQSTRTHSPSAVEIMINGW